jgi:hypothetical protein
MKYLGQTQSGSDGGTTASRNRFGQYLRRRAVPVQPRTPAQVDQRARMSLNAAAWRGLTDAQRAGWGSLGSQMTRRDSLGQTYTMTGFMAYASVNTNNLVAGNAVVADAPVLMTPDAIVSATITLTHAAFSVAYTPTPLGAGERLLIFASPQQSAGRTFNGDYRLIAVTAAAAASPANILTAYTAKFGVPLTGNKIFLSLQRYLGGFTSAPLLTAQVVA